MSDFIAEAAVLVRPDTRKFRAELQTQLKLATKGVTVPVTIVPSLAGTAAAAQTAGVLRGIGDAAKSSNKSLLGAASATAKLDAALLGLRTAVGSAAVIGLGALSLAAIVAGQAIRASLSNFADFQAELATFRVTASATAEQMVRVRAQAVALGADIRLPGVSAQDAAVAMTELAKAGLTVEEAMAGAEGVLQLATAAQISNADAALIAANALNSFGLEGEQATEVADTLANASNAAQGSITDFGLALRQSSAVARQVGLSLEDTTAILSLFAKNGLQGSDAGTSLRVALIRLVAPTKAAREEIERLGLRIRDAQGNFRADVFAQFGEATENLGPAARDAAAALIFGQDAIRAVSIGAREGADGLRIMQFEIDQQGTAAEIAAARTSGLAGAFSALQSNAQNLGVTLGAVLSGPIADTAKNFATIFGVIDSGVAKLGELNAQIPDEEDGFFGQLSSDINEIGKNLATPGAALVNVLRLTGALGKAGTDTAKRLEDLNTQLQLLQTARVQAAKGGQFGIAEQLTKQIEDLRNQIQALNGEGGGITDGVTAPLREAVETLKSLRDVRVELDLPTTSIDIFIRRLEEQANIAQQTGGNIQRLRDDFLDLGGAGSTSAGGVDALTQALNALNAAAFAANSQLLKLQNEGASPQAQIANLQQQRQIQEDRIAAIQANGNQAGDATAINAARTEINRIQAQIDSLQQGIVSDQEAAATSAERAAKDAQAARDKQFEALAEMFGGRQENIRDAIETAGIKGNIQAVIRLNKALIEALKREREALLERLRTLKVSNEARRKIMAAIEDAIDEAKNDLLRAQQAQQDALQKLLEPIDLRIRIAQAQDNEAKEIALRRKKVELLSKELAKLKNAGKKNTKQWLELKAQLAEENQAIRDLQNQQKTDGKTARQEAAEFLFEQLQAQQGFASNLMGNLITGPTEGLVGVPSTPGQKAAVTSNAAQAKGDRGPTSGQAQTANDILLRILQQLKVLNGSQTTPEAARQYKVGQAGMDGAGGVHGI